MTLECCSNTKMWISSLDERIECILLKKLTDAIKHWQKSRKDRADFVMEFKMKNMSIVLEPSLAAARLHLYDDLETLIGTFILKKYAIAHI